MPDLLPFEAAIARVLAEVRPLASDRVRLADAADRILAAALVAPRDVPHESASLMDGYAVRAAEVDAGSSLRIAFEVRAGRVAPRALAAGECARILTGAPLPEGADAVVMQEHVHLDGDRVTFGGLIGAGEHVRPAGSDARAGTVLLPRGHRLNAGSLALAATLGFDALEVGRTPKVALLASGDELVAPGQPLRPGQIYESNTPALVAQAREASADPILLGTRRDDPDALLDALGSCEADVLVTSGGASVGDYDFAAEVLGRMGGRTVFRQVAIRPGRPIVFGVLEDPRRLFFALPGNPGASALTFDLLVRPALLALQGAAEPRRRRIRVALTKPLRKPPHLTFLARGRLVVDDARLTFDPLTAQGSMSITSLATMDAVAIVPPGADSLPAGAVVDVEPWRL